MKIGSSQGGLKKEREKGRTMCTSTSIGSIFNLSLLWSEIENNSIHTFSVPRKRFIQYPYQYPLKLGWSNNRIL